MMPFVGDQPEGGYPSTGEMFERADARLAAEGRQWPPPIEDNQRRYRESRDNRSGRHAED